MTTAKTNYGFVLTFVIIVLALIAMYMVVLTENTKTILFQTNLAYLDACEQNLAASGLSWAENNVKAQITDDTIELDTSDMCPRQSGLSISISPGQNDKANIKIVTGCNRARHKRARIKEYRL